MLASIDGEDVLRLTENDLLTDEQRQEFMTDGMTIPASSQRKRLFCECGHSLQGHDPMKSGALLNLVLCGIVSDELARMRTASIALPKRLSRRPGFAVRTAAFLTLNQECEATIDMVGALNKRRFLTAAGSRLKCGWQPRQQDGSGVRFRR